METNIIIALQSISNKYLDILFQGISYLASWIGAIFLFLIIILFVNKRFGVIFGIGYLGTICVNYVLKVIVNRPRPFEVNSQIVNKLQTIGKSFPSGHMVSCTFIVLAIWLLIKTLQKKGRLKHLNKTVVKIVLIIVGVLFIIFTAISRMYLGQHYLTDIIGGILVSLCGFTITYFVYKKFDKNQNKC